MIRKWGFVLLFLMVASGLSAFDDPFKWDYSVSPARVSPNGEFVIELQISIPKGHYLYKQKTKLDLLEGKGVEFKKTDFSKSHIKKDKFFGKEMEIFDDRRAVLKTTLRVNSDAMMGEAEPLLLLTYQGCSQSLCFRQMRHEIPVVITVAGHGGETEFDDSSGFLWKLLLAFLGGILTDFTPCVLPIIPLTLGFIGVRKETNISKNLVMTSFLILSMALSYAVLGLVGTFLGKSVGFLFQGLPFLIGTAILYVVFSFALMGWIPFQLPLTLRNRVSQIGGQGILGASLAGVGVGCLAAPCVGPVIASLLVYVSQTGDVVKGFLLLFSFGLGMGSLFLVFAAFYHTLVGKLPGAFFTIWSKRILAILMLLPAIYYGSIAYDQIQKKRGVESGVTASSFWITDPDEAFLKAKQENKPIFVDFFATWCLPCLEMEKKTFEKPEIQEFLETEFVPLKIDCTGENAACTKMIDAYKIIGWPTYLVLDSKGKVLKSFVGEVIEAEDFKSRVLP